MDAPAQWQTVLVLGGAGGEDGGESAAVLALANQGILGQYIYIYIYIYTLMHSLGARIKAGCSASQEMTRDSMGWSGTPGQNFVNRLLFAERISA